MRPFAALLASACLVLGADPAFATKVGDIQACYNCSHNFGGIGVVDGPTFLFENTSGGAITNGVFTADALGLTLDIFVVGTIPAGGSVIVEPGVSTDGNAHTGFFSLLGGVRDTSDIGPSDGATQFLFTGLLGALPVTSSIFTPSMTAGPSPDGTIASENFLGGGPQSDGPCNDCFGPQIIATLSTSSAVPEPATLALLGVGLAGLGFLRRKQ